MTAHPFDTVPLPSPSRKYRDTCGVCGGLISEHPEAPENMRELLRELADCLCGTKIVTHAQRNALLARLDRYSTK